MKRIQQTIITKDLNKKMVLLVGPRQAGKTWIAKEIAQTFKRSVYLNYDQILDRKKIQNQSWLPDTQLLVLDELHKMKGWKNYLKGVFDTRQKNMKLLVTGSARLDVYDQVGDSLAGRYFRHRLYPFSLAELKQLSYPLDMGKLIRRGGFPEPYLEETDIEAKRWRSQYVNSLLSTDVFDVGNIQNIKALRLIFELLRNRVGSPISYQSLAEDVQISPITVKKYIQTLEAIFVIFSVSPFSKNIARSLLKEPKIYFYDTALVEGGEGATLENFVAISLLKSLHYKNDVLGENNKLHYIRTKDGEEVDFSLIKDGKIELLVEVKQSDEKINKTLKKLHQKHDVESIQIVQHLRNEFEESGVKVLKAENFLSSLAL